MRNTVQGTTRSTPSRRRAVRLAGGAIAGATAALVLGGPALATPHAAQRPAPTDSRHAAAPTPGPVEIGTALAYVRGPDGTVHRVP